MPPKTNPRPLGGFEIAVLAHVGIFLVAATWAFGGNAGFVRPYLSLWGGIGGVITLTAVLANQRRSQISRAPLKGLWPFGLFNALVLISSFTPLLRPIQLGGESFWAPVTMPVWRPAAAHPELARQALWLFDGIYLSCFNLALVVRHRRGLRALLLIAAGNALALSVFGTVQKLTAAKGLFFGLVDSPQTYFFASFIYHNHWGSFIVLMAAICLGLIRHYAQRSEGRDFFHTPAFGGIVAVLFLSLTVPLSTSRSCTLLLLVLLGGAFLNWISRLMRQRRDFRESVSVPLGVAAIAIALGLGGVWFLARDVVAMRIAKTEEQISDMRARGDLGNRFTLYHDTWRMAEDRILLGWGMASYPYVFLIYNTQEPNPLDHLPVYYHDAHNDWLQAFAEHGLIGSALLGLCAVVPAFGLRRRSVKSPLALYLLAGCGLILLYAWVEFPFGNIAVVLSWWICFFTALRYTLLDPSNPVQRISPIPAPSRPQA